MTRTKKHITAVLLAALSLLALAAPAGATESQALYQRVKDDYAWLKRSEKASAIYHNWQTLAERFARIYAADPRGKLAPGCLLWMGRIHEEAYERFRRETDFNDALDLYQRLISHFPRSRLADDAQYNIGRLYEKDGQIKKAYLEYLKVTTNHPKGDQLKKAKARLDRLERRIANGRHLKPPAKAKPGPKTDPTLAQVTKLRHWSTPTYTRVVMELERPVPYKAHLLKSNPKANRPRRIYLDLRGAHLGDGIQDNTPIGDGLLIRARAGQYRQDTVRLVLDTKTLASYKVFTLDNPFRVVVDCFAPRLKSPRQAYRKAAKGQKVPRGRAKELPPKLGLAAALGLNIRRVVLDPGHGGKDPGCSMRGLKEKNITLDVAQRTARQLKKLMGCQVILTRNRDHFISLEARNAVANTRDADLFVSIHVNAAPSHRLSGIETYFLNLASDEESMRVAARENATTRRSISDLQVILNDLMLNSKINESNRLARSVQKGMLSSLRKHYRTRDLKVKQAPFYVLIGARMPSVLVEVGFITNPTEHRRLASRTYRNRVAHGIAMGIKAYARSLKAGARR